MRKNIVSDICDLIRIPSVFDEQSACNGAPFGKEIGRCLNEVLEKGKAMGFETRNLDGFIGEMDMGKGKHIIGVLCHSDVVPAGEGWETDPFDPVIKNSRIYGRGSSDDKGPLVLSMYVVKKLMDDGMIPEDVTIRVIVGTNEEEMWEDINYYKEHRDIFPECTISPDGVFPLVYCEKGLYDVNFIYPSNGDNKAPVQLDSLSGGAARNAVPAKAVARIIAEKEVLCRVAGKLKEAANEKSIEASFNEEGNSIEITVIGRSTHAMTPEKGINAISQLITMINDAVGAELSHYNFTERYCKYIGMDYLGKKAGFSCSDSESGELTFNIGTITMDKEEIRLTSSIRYPASSEAEIIKNNIRHGFSESEFGVQFIDYLPPVYFSKDDKMVNILYGSYTEKSGDKTNKPIAIGGATYARALPRTIAFGPIFPDEEEIAHEPNEYIDIDRLMTAGEIYYDTLKKLCSCVSEL